MAVVFVAILASPCLSFPHVRFRLAAYALVGFGESVKAHTSPTVFDFDSGNAGIEVIIPTVIPALFETTAPNDAPIVLRHTTLITNAWFDAIAPYHPTAVGIYSRLGRRPATEALTNRHKNVALFYASYRVLNRLMPRFAPRWRQMLSGVGLNPDDDRVDLTTAVGIGNVAGRQVAAARERDGMNQLVTKAGWCTTDAPMRTTRTTSRSTRLTGSGIPLGGSRSSRHRGTARSASSGS